MGCVAVKRRVKTTHTFFREDTRTHRHRFYIGTHVDPHPLWHIFAHFQPQHQPHMNGFHLLSFSFRLLSLCASLSLLSFLSLYQGHLLKD